MLRRTLKASETQPKQVQLFETDDFLAIQEGTFCLLPSIRSALKVSRVLTFIALKIRARLSVLDSVYLVVPVMFILLTTYRKKWLPDLVIAESFHCSANMQIYHHRSKLLSTFKPQFENHCFRIYSVEHLINSLTFTVQNSYKRCTFSLHV